VPPRERTRRLSRPAVAYLGWSGRGNLGDDAIELAMRAAIPDATFIQLPLSIRETSRFLVRSAGRLPVRDAHVLLGGGTVIGRTNWRYPLRIGLATARRRPAHMLGAGVEDPAFRGRHSFSGNNELAKWKSVLGRFATVTVRGPRSADLLAGIGVTASVVGDPALLLGAPTAARYARSDGVVGINLGHGDDLWGHNQEGVVRAAADLAADLTHRGFAVRFLVANPGDLASTQRCVYLSGLRLSDVRVVTDPVAFVAEAAACSVVVGQRLHAVVLATAAGVPAVMLEYQPKCLDFMLSVGREDWSVRTDRLDGGKLSEMVRELAAERQQHQQEIASAVHGLQGELTREAELIRGSLAV
jgi:polysaccharide pyruvyl transferase WcaK-like protein